jgi:hypothetical protein
MSKVKRWNIGLSKAGEKNILDDKKNCFRQSAPTLQQREALFGFYFTMPNLRLYVNGVPEAGF